MRVLVTGGTGFVGSHIVEALVEAGHTVRCLVRPTSNRQWLEGLDVEFRLGDCRDADSLRAAMSGVEAVVHAAGLTKARRVEDFYEVNAEGTRRAAEAACEVGAQRFVLVSSQAAAGPSPDGIPIDENAPCRPVSDYGLSKLRAEEAACAFCDRIRVGVLRPSAVFGPRDRDVYIYFLLARYGLRPRLGLPEARLNVCYAPDVADAVARALVCEYGSGEKFFVADSRPVSWAEMSAAIARAVRTRGIEFAVPPTLTRVAAAATETMAKFFGQAVIFGRQKANEMLQTWWLCDTTKASRVLGFRPRWSLEEACRFTAEWYRRHGWL